MLLSTQGPAKVPTSPLKHFLTSPTPEAIFPLSFYSFSSLPNWPHLPWAGQVVLFLEAYPDLISPSAWPGLCLELSRAQLASVHWLTHHPRLPSTPNCPRSGLCAFVVDWYSLGFSFLLTHLPIHKSVQTHPLRPRPCLAITTSFILLRLIQPTFLEHFNMSRILS